MFVSKSRWNAMNSRLNVLESIVHKEIVEPKMIKELGNLEKEMSKFLNKIKKTQAMKNNKVKKSVKKEKK